MKCCMFAFALSKQNLLIQPCTLLHIITVIFIAANKRRDNTVVGTIRSAPIRYIMFTSILWLQNIVKQVSVPPASPRS